MNAHNSNSMMSDGVGESEDSIAPHIDLHISNRSQENEDVVNIDIQDSLEFRSVPSMQLNFNIRQSEN